MLTSTKYGLEKVAITQCTIWAHHIETDRQYSVDHSPTTKQKLTTTDTQLQQPPRDVKGALILHHVNERHLLHS